MDWNLWSQESNRAVMTIVMNRELWIVSCKQLAYEWNELCSTVECADSLLTANSVPPDLPQKNQVWLQNCRWTSKRSGNFNESDKFNKLPHLIESNGRFANKFNGIV